MDVHDFALLQALYEVDSQLEHAVVIHSGAIINGKMNEFEAFWFLWAGPIHHIIEDARSIENIRSQLQPLPPFPPTSTELTAVITVQNVKSTYS